MKLEEGIHQRWAASNALVALLPASSVKTGRNVGDTLPYATVLRRGSRTAFRANSGEALDEVSLRIRIWHDDFDAWRAIAEAAKAAFDRSDFSLSDGDRLVQMLRTGD